MTVYKSLPMAQVARDYQCGDSLRTVAERYSVSYGTIRRALIAAGVPLRVGGFSSDPPTVKTHVVRPTPTMVAWTELRPGALHPAEVAKLRRAVGWRPEWAIES